MPMFRARWQHNATRLVLSGAVLPPPHASNASELIRVEALLDTGATGSGIRQDIADKLGLKPKGNRRVLTANGFLMADEFLFRIGLIGGDYFDPLATMPYVLDTRVAGFALASGFPYALLIGMDVIGKGDLTIRRDGQAEFAI